MSLELKQILTTIPHVGRVDWIGLRPTRREEVVEVASADVLTEIGLVNDHYSGKPGSPRQVTLIQAEHLEAMSRILGMPKLSPSLLRRNIVVSGINLLSLKDRYFSVGDVVLFGTGNCQPCSRMEENLGPGGYNSMRGHGGITARVEEGGTITIGADVRFLKPKDASNYS